MPRFFCHSEQQITQQVPSSYQQEHSIEGKELIDFNSIQIHQESSPSFCTQENHQFQFQLGNQFSLTSQQSSVSQFQQEFYNPLSTHQFQDFLNKNNTINLEKSHKMQKYSEQDSYIPSLKSFESSGPSDQMVFFKKQNNFSESDSYFFEQKQSQKYFFPDIKSLTQHVNFLQDKLFQKTKQNLQLITFCSAVIASVKTFLSHQIGVQLQKYMKQKFPFQQTTQTNQFFQQDSLQKDPSKHSKEFISKLNSESLSYSIDLNSKQLQKSVEEIFTLGSSKFLLSRNQSFKSKEKDIKSTEKKTQNFKKNKSDKQNIRHQIQFQTDKKLQKHKKQQKKLSNISIRNESMKFLMNDCNSTENSSASTPRSSLNYRNPTVATELLCQVCSHCFQPSQFFNHLSKCTTSHKQSICSLKSTQKMTFNYTKMMEKLFDMRQEIESQIQLLQKSKQKSKQMSERQRLKKKLKNDLQKVIQIIQEKEKQMKIHLFQNVQCKSDKISR